MVKVEDMDLRSVTLHLYDHTMGDFRELEIISEASIYTCGITPYDSSHLGHVATFTYFDVLVRLLNSFDIDVTLVRNITDLDDPLFERVRQTGEDLDVLIGKNVARLDADLLALNCISPHVEPYSSHYIDPMIRDIEKLLSTQNAYSVDGWTYFDISTRDSYPEFNILLELSHNELGEIASQRGAHLDDPRKKHPLDFVLWKPSAIDEPAFDTPFGRGRPGWHIECSVMALEILGDTIDIHGGGDDLIFPHHACEVAQSESLTGVNFVRHFMHTAPIKFQGEKMSKSLGNLIYAGDVIEDIGENATRLLLLKYHYREGFEYSRDDAFKARDQWRSLMRYMDSPQVRGELYETVRNALRNDLDVPGAIAQIEQSIRTQSASPGDVAASLSLLGFRSI